MLSELYFYKNTCRICGSVSGICTNLVENAPGNYLQKVEALIPIKISSEDKLPKKICHICRTTIHDFYSLREHCMRTQDSLIVTAQSFNGSEEVENVTEAKEFDQRKIIEVVQYKVTNASRHEDIKSDQPKVTKVAQPGVSKVAQPKIEEVGEDEADIEKNPNVERWTIQRIPSGDVLCLCNNCNAILTSEASMTTHRCSSKIIQQPVVETNKNQSKPRTKKTKSEKNSKDNS